MKRIRKSVTVLLVLWFFGAAACARRPQTPPSRSGERPCRDCIAGVENFAKVSPALWRGAQPTAEGFRKLKAAGVKTVVSLRERHDDWPLLSDSGLKYVRVPSQAWDPEEAQRVLALKIVQNPANWPVFIHCLEGQDRTGYTVATYRILIEGWTATDAIHEMFDFGFNPLWFRNPAFIQQLDRQRLTALLSAAP